MNESTPDATGERLIELEVVLPAHNERDSIGPTLEEIHSTITSRLPSTIIVCEDGSSDGTPEHVSRLATRLPIDLHSSEERKGYSRAVKDGLLAVRAPWVLCLDSDGQCDPADFWKLWDRRNEGPVVVGWRKPRRDPWLRRLLSRVFYFAFRILFRSPLHDPSSPMVLISRTTIQELAPRMGKMDQGFWWEFSARCCQAGIEPIEVPIRHRLRSAGETHIYRLTRLPGIFIRHLAALVEIRFESDRRTE